MKTRSTIVFAVAAALSGLVLPVQANDDDLFVASHAGPKSRAEVRDELMRARATGTISLGGEQGDSDQVLAARETFNELQREVMLANQVRLAERRRAVLMAMAREQPLP